MTRRSPELVASIAEDLASGMPIKYAAAAHGVSPRTLTQWITEALDSDSTNPLTPLVQARADFMRTTLKRLASACSDKSSRWQGYAWMLERSFPDEWGNRSTGRTTSDVPSLPAAQEPNLVSFRDVDPAR